MLTVAVWNGGVPVCKLRDKFVFFSDGYLLNGSQNLATSSGAQ